MTVTNNSREAPTSGRYVYKTRGSKVWYWQCDLHNDEFNANPDPEWEGRPEWHGPDEGFKNQPEALADALAHVPNCGHTNS